MTNSRITDEQARAFEQAINRALPGDEIFVWPFDEEEDRDLLIYSVPGGMATSIEELIYRANNVTKRRSRAMTMDQTIPFDQRHLDEFSDVDSRSMVVSGDEARLYRAIWRAFPDSPWFLIKTLRDNRYVPHNPDCPMLYSVRPMRGKMPEGFAAVFEKGLHEPELYEWVDMDGEEYYSINAEELESMIRAFEGWADSHGQGTRPCGEA